MKGRDILNSNGESEGECGGNEWRDGWKEGEYVDYGIIGGKECPGMKLVCGWNAR